MASHYYLIELYLDLNIDTIIENHIYYNMNELYDYKKIP